MSTKADTDGPREAVDRTRTLDEVFSEMDSFKL